jgi:hydrophobic/amphiphilic exporter-1 (mainly G- bacteria), HAE1 family
MVSQALTLFTTPVVYIYLDRFSSWLTRKTHTVEYRSDPQSRAAA